MLITTGVDSNAQAIDYPNNIIAFCGERGQGKSTAMINFAEKLRVENINSNSGTKADSFFVLPRIDPTQIEKHENIITIVLGQLLREFKKRLDDKQNEQVKESTKQDILRSFNECIELISVIKRDKRPEESYEDNLTMLLKRGEGVGLRENMKELIKQVIKELGKENLVISIDDTDLNIQRAYEIVEDVRKYLVIPHVVVLFATKLEQLSEAIEQQFRKDFEKMLNAGRIGEYEPQLMATQYIAKLIPERRRIYLPELNSELNMSVRFVEGSNNDTALERLPDGNKENYQDQLFDLIYQKTLIRFAKSDHMELHPITPSTLRGLVEMFSFLRTLKDANVDQSGLPDAKIWQYNLEAFELYFLKTWIPSKLDERYVKNIHQLVNTPDHRKHERVITDIYSILAKSKVFPLLGENEAFNDTTRSKARAVELSEILDTHPDPLYFSVGEVLDAIFEIKNEIRDSATRNYIFSINTVYTITMYKLLVKALGAEDVKAKKKGSPEALYLSFVGDDLFGIKNMMRFFPSRREGGEELNRGVFSIVKDQINPKIPIPEEYFWEHYKDSDQIRNNNGFIPFIRKTPNGATSALYYRPSARIIMALRDQPPKSKKYFDQTVLLLNMEFISMIVEEQINDQSKGKGGHQFTNLLSRFSSNINKVADKYKSVFPINVTSDKIDAIYNLLIEKNSNESSSETNTLKRPFTNKSHTEFNSEEHNANSEIMLKELQK